MRSLGLDRYSVYLVAVALAGWALASYDVNLLVLALPAIAKDLNISQAGLGFLGLCVFGAQFCITLFAGYGMDTFGRRRMWMFCLTGTAIFTGITYFVNEFWQLCVVRALATGLAYSEVAVSITIVSEQVPARGRGFLYSIVQGGWPLGVCLASGVYLSFGHLGWRFVFLLGVLPLVVVLFGRVFIRESERFTHLQEVRDAHRAGDKVRLDTLLKRHAVAVKELDRVTLGQLFSSSGSVRRQLVLLSVIWILYGAAIVPTNFYITYWLTNFKSFSPDQASELLLICGGIGFFFYILGGLLGERFGRRAVLIGTGILVAPLSLAFLYVHAIWAVSLVYFFLYQATNGTWSGAGYAYQGESFPTRIRGTAVGFLSAVQIVGFLVGTMLWTVLSTTSTPNFLWLVVAVILPLGLWATFFLRKIPPGQELEQISQ
jgi:MFS family permease